ncbi:MAG: hypothetical protein RSE59_10850, partial [Clostridia bacterium]
HPRHLFAFSLIGLRHLILGRTAAPCVVSLISGRDVAKTPYFNLDIPTIRRHAVAVHRVVVVERARRVDNAHVVRVAGVRGAQPHGPTS